MKRAHLLIPILGMAGAFSACAPAGTRADASPGRTDVPRESADLILHSATVYTGTGATGITAAAIRDGVIVATGDDATITARYAGSTIDLTGRMLLPGFHDAHVHPVSGGVEALRCDLLGLSTLPLVMERIRACEAALPPDGWLQGGGFSLSLFGAEGPHRRLLDEVADRAIFLMGEDGHTAWASSRALELAGVAAETPDPALGVIERDSDGTPTGALRESAVGLVSAVAPEPTPREWLDGARHGLRMANRFGITSLIDASVGVAGAAAWRALEAEGTLTARIVLSALTVGTGADEASRNLVRPADRDTDALVRAHAAKIFLDGVLEGETAALLDPYVGGSGAQRGMLTVPQSELDALVADLDRRNVQIHVHAIGDGATRAALDAIEAARAVNGSRDNRHHISHLQLVHPNDHARFATLDVTANFQALWAFPDAYITDLNLPVVGPERVARMYPVASLQRAGARMVGGSDWSVSSMNPLQAIETAVTRQDAAGVVSGILNENERVDLETMLAAHTVNGAWLMNQEHRVGMIAPGMLADLVVLERDLFAVAPSGIGEVRVLLTLFGGATVWDAGELAVVGVADPQP